MTQDELERAAVAAFARGDTWTQFFADMGPSIRALEPFNARRYRRLTDHLLCLIVAGDVIGHVPVGDDDETPGWVRDDALGEVSDTHTNARLLSPWTIQEGTP